MIDAIKKVIPQELVVKDFIDLSDVNTSSKLYQRLAPLKEDVFNDNVRIVFYHSSSLNYSFNDLPADILIALQKMLVYVDIPNFFCLVVSNNNLSRDMILLLRYTVNDVPLTFIQL